MVWEKRKCKKNGVVTGGNGGRGRRNKKKQKDGVKK